MLYCFACKLFGNIPFHLDLTGKFLTDPAGYVSQYIHGFDTDSEFLAKNVGSRLGSIFGDPLTESKLDGLSMIGEFQWVTPDMRRPKILNLQYRTLYWHMDKELEYHPQVQ